MGLFEPDDEATRIVRPALAAAPIKRPAPKQAPTLAKAVTKLATKPVGAATIATTTATTTATAYDPANPNDYDEMFEQKRKKRQMTEKRLETMRVDRMKTRAAAAAAADREAKQQTDKDKVKVEKGLPLAQKLMMKMGWERGAGLGKSNQGITAPLAVTKTSARGGTIDVDKR